MPVVDLFIDSASGNKVISFLDGNLGYNQFSMAKEEVISCPRFVGLFEWVVMTFGLKNASATYQRVDATSQQRISKCANISQRKVGHLPPRRIHPVITRHRWHLAWRG
jgi:hypothetical protein